MKKTRTNLYNSEGVELTSLEVAEKIQNICELIPLVGVTRVEVIDQTGRAYTKYFDRKESIAQLSFQDTGRTLKIFIG